MSVSYSAVQWSRHKRVYDAAIAIAVLVYIGGFFAISALMWRGREAISDEIVLIRATGSCAIVLLHVILCIGPMARMWPRMLPIVYNRRHLGVTTFLVALVHGAVSVGYYHGFGVVGALESLLTSNTNYFSLTAFPFQILGVAALMVMFLLAATSHDFWLKFLSARWWKALHMLVYVAYALLIAHVALGALQSERSGVAPVLVAMGAAIVCGLHLAAGIKERRRDRGGRLEDGEWIDVGTPGEIPADRARTVCAPGGERIAVFKHAGAISAVTNVCAHQGGPLGEGKVIDGCVTCPWHGWQYKPQDGCSPPPFQEKIATYQVRIVAGRVQVKAKALPPGTATTPAKVEEA